MVQKKVELNKRSRIQLPPPFTQTARVVIATRPVDTATVVANTAAPNTATSRPPRTATATSRPETATATPDTLGDAIRESIASATVETLEPVIGGGNRVVILADSAAGVSIVWNDAESTITIGAQPILWTATVGVPLNGPLGEVDLVLESALDHLKYDVFVVIKDDAGTILNEKAFSDRGLVPINGQNTDRISRTELAAELPAGQSFVVWLEIRGFDGADYTGGLGADPDIVFRAVEKEE